MSNPMPLFDPLDDHAMCCLCFSVVPYSSLAVGDWPQYPTLIDVCLGCRAREIHQVLRTDRMYKE